MIILDGNSLSIDEVVRVSREYETVTLDDKSIPGVI